MRINAQVESVTSHVHLRVTGFGSSPTQGELDGALDFTFEVPNTERNRKAFYVGRKIAVDIEPR